ncbi:MAG: hypothetical protein IPL71_03740 [Anaerolineales bacterium]|uniref:hypothetical protein n=1 Tax=Candidatus Villigracilis proximus TaxID=3140683 RepID=UPI003134B3DD|nr:hypothetical protein [Anaerolineales bacterium]
MLYFNLLHRPAENPSQRASFALQQRMAHDLGLKVTLLVDYQSLCDEETVAELKTYANDFGDELGVWFMNLPPAADSADGRHEPFIWLYADDEKRRIIEQVLTRFKATFGVDPVSVGSYHLDAESLRILKELAPSIQIAVAGCFEEGVRVYHGCNNSWYLFSEGMPWAPWYPSRTHSLRPAQNEADSLGIVAVPHLSRDLVLSYEGRNDFFATHPANVQRAMANDGMNNPYMYNLVDQHRLQADFNDGFAYVHIFVGPAWMSNDSSIQDTDDVTQGLYREFLEYFVELRKLGQATDMKMSEFAAWYRDNIPIGKPQVALAKEMLYGTGKHYFWYLDSFTRILIDPTQGGSIGDLRPYAAQIESHTGADAKALWYGSYPYLIQSQHRTGNSYHYADGSRTTLLVTHKDETLDLANVRVKVAEVTRAESETALRLTPATLTFSDGTRVSIETTYRFLGGGKILIERKLLEGEDVRAQEYVKACWGLTEYPEDLRNVILTVSGKTSEEMRYEYRSREIRSEAVTAVAAQIPQIQTKISLQAEGTCESGAVMEGYLFSPYFTLTLNGALRAGKVMRTWLNIEKI